MLAPASVVFFLVYVGLFYLNAYVLVPKLYLEKKYAAYVLVSLVLLAAIVWLKPYDRLMHLNMHPFDDERMPRFEGRQPPFDHQFRRPPVHDRREGPGLDLTSIVLFLAIWSVGMALQIFRQWRQTERRALQAEAEKINAELSFLRRRSTRISCSIR